MPDSNDTLLTAIITLIIFFLLAGCSNIERKPLTMHEQKRKEIMDVLGPAVVDAFQAIDPDGGKTVKFKYYGE